MKLMDWEEKTYLSSNNICESEHLHTDFEKALYARDVLNRLSYLVCLDIYKLPLKVGVHVMLLHNIDQPGGSEYKL